MLINIKLFIKCCNFQLACSFVDLEIYIKNLIKLVNCYGDWDDIIKDWGLGIHNIVVMSQMMGIGIMCSKFFLIGFHFF